MCGQPEPNAIPTAQMYCFFTTSSLCKVWPAGVTFLDLPEVSLNKNKKNV